MINSYKEAVNYIEEIPKFTTKNKLEHTKDCLRRLGNPQNHFRVIHVAGTNGKGSTCAFITSILREAGYSCGLFTSPHLITTNERFQINEEMIDDDTFLKAFQKVKQLSDELVAEGSYHPTYFEFLFLMGMIVFADAGVDYVTLETGLGGRMDATSSIENPIVCVITSISLDHQQYLGDTVPLIAKEKAGIIVPGVPVIYDGNDPEAAEVIRQQAIENGAPYYEVTKDHCHVEQYTPEGIDFVYEGASYPDAVYHIPFAGRYQVMNSALALKTIDVLKEQISVSEQALMAGIAQTKWQGRMETVLPGVIVDGAHNEDGITRFVETASHFQKDYEITMLFSAVSDKDYEGMIRRICETIQLKNVIATQIDGYRVVPAETLANIFKTHGVDAIACPVIPEAFQKAREKKGAGLLFCVGSLYLVGEIKAIVAGETDKGEKHD